MKTPQNLINGDKIRFVSTARKITKEEIKYATEVIESWGLIVENGENLFETDNQFAGTDNQRLSDFQKALDNPKIKAIICVRGGYGTVRIIDELDFTKFIESPKWIVGYSDITVLHSHIHTNLEIKTIHATMPINFLTNSKEALLSLKDALFGNTIYYDIAANPLNKSGISSGQLIGGNLSILQSLSGTNSDIDTKGKILFIEDLDEYLYHVDRMMFNLKKSEKLSGLAGLIVGGFTEMKDNSVPFGKTAEQIISESVQEYDFPVCFDFPAGHINDNRALILGEKIFFEVSGKSVRVRFN